MKYRVYFHGDAENTEIKATSQVDAFEKSVEFLINNHNLLEYVSLPFVPGKTKALINEAPKNPDSSEMSQYKEISQGVFLNVNYNRGEKQNLLDRLANFCDLDVHYFGWDQ